METHGLARRAYLKPANPHPNAAFVARAAREKIASDLAHDLGLPVPPVLLTTRDNPPAGCESAVAVSLVMYPRQWAWEHVRASPPEDLPKGLALAKAFTACGPMLAFDTWLDQVDHSDHPHNVVWGHDPSDLASEIVFLDFAFSMGFYGQWTNGGWKNCVKAPFPPLLTKYLNTAALQQAVAAIQQLDGSVIEEIVTRIPGSHLGDEQKKTILEGLLGRRLLIASALGV